MHPKVARNPANSYQQRSVRMHVFTLWQPLRDETNFCWERCPCHTTPHRNAPGQKDQPRIPEGPSYHHTQHHHHHISASYNAILTSIPWLFQRC